jgi:hypothetical protein
MSDSLSPQSEEMSPLPVETPEETPEDTLERLVAERPEPTPEVAAAVAELEAAREEVAASLGELSDATHSALDFPAKIKRNPVKTAALLGGAGFLMAGGPRRAARFVARQVLPQPRPDPNGGLLPPEIEKVLKNSGVAKDPEVRRALNKDFAQYMRQKGKYGPEPSPATSFWRTFDRVAGPLGTAGARVMVQRLMEAERDRALRRAEARDQATAKDGE